MGKYLDIARRIRPTVVEPSTTDEVVPTIAGDEINRIVDGLDAKFLGVKPKGWLPNWRADG
jgi:hypothetical protein